MSTPRYVHAPSFCLMYRARRGGPLFPSTVRYHRILYHDKLRCLIIFSSYLIVFIIGVLRPSCRVSAALGLFTQVFSADRATMTETTPIQNVLSGYIPHVCPELPRRAGAGRSRAYSRGYNRSILITIEANVPGIRVAQF